MTTDRDFEREILTIAAAGPTGVVRPCGEIRQRIAEERRELGEALVDGDVADVLEEAGDVLYYAVLLRHNGCGAPRRPEDALDGGVWRHIADTLERWYGTPVSVGRAVALARVAALAKFRHRFFVNGCRKDKDSEHAEILAAIEEASMPVKVKERIDNAIEALKGLGEERRMQWLVYFAERLESEFGKQWLVELEAAIRPRMAAGGW